MAAATTSWLDTTLSALADPTRRAILQRLSKGETRVTELARPFSISLNSVSKHIRMLERAKLVRRRRAGREHLLSLNPRALDETARWIEAQRVLWAERRDARDGRDARHGTAPAAQVRGGARSAARATRGTRRARPKSRP